MPISFTDIFSGNPVQPASVSFVAYSLTGNIFLNWPTQFLDVPNVTANIINISVNADNYNIFLPPANLTSVGQSIIFVNTSEASHYFNVLDNTDGFLAQVDVGQSVLIYLNNNSTIAGSWNIIPFGGGFSAVTSVGAVSDSDAIIITGSPITSAGTLTFDTADALTSLADLNSTGILVQSSIGTLVTRSLVDGSNIDITNPDGVSANPLISLSDTITGINSINVGNFNLSGNIISTTTVNTPIHIIPDGTGQTIIGPGLSPPTFSSTGNLSNINILTVDTAGSISQVGIINFTISSIDVTGNLTVSATGTGHLQLKGASNTNILTLDQNNNLFHPSVPKAGVKFDNTGNIVSQYNITSVVKNSTGNFTITIPGGLFSSNPNPLVSTSTNAGSAIIGNASSTSTTTINFFTFNTAGVATDTSLNVCYLFGI